MTREVVHRPARSTAPPADPQPLVLAPPPAADDSAAGFPLQAVLPIVGSLSSITMMVLLRGNPMFVVIGAVILVVALVGGIGLAFTARGTAVRQRRLQRERYLDHLERVRSDLRERAGDVRAEALRRHPAPGALIDAGHDPARRWERRPGDADFLDVRVGVADLPLLPLSLPEETNPVAPSDPIMRAAASRLVDAGRIVQRMPATIDLAVGGQVAIIGGRAEVLGTARALAAQIATFHSPEEVHLAAVIPASALPEWRGFDLLPHAQAPQADPNRVLSRRVAPTLDDLMSTIGGEIRDRVAAATAARRAGRTSRPVRLVLFLDEGDGVATPIPRWDPILRLADLGITVIHLLDDRLKEPGEVSARIVIDDAGRMTIAGAGREPVDGVVGDAVEAALLDTIARPLAPLRLTRASASEASETAIPDLGGMLGVGDLLELDTRRSWAPRTGADFLRVPLGVDDRGDPVLLDLKESAQLGMGPHGICIGATGSGKSELLRTLVLGLATTHGPDDLSMILVDYKGGAAFAPFARLPHIAGLIDNLADDPQLIERARASINGEVVRRQQLLKSAGDAASITEYRQRREERPDLPVLPHLFLVIDEFGELLTAEPDFVDLLLTIGRIGRSIGVHLLLSSQRIDAGRLRGLDTYLSYRLGLRTFSTAESAMVLDTADAFHLPAIPGYAYLKVDTSVYTRLRAGYVSGPAPESDLPETDADDEPRVRVIPPYDAVQPPTVAEGEPVVPVAATRSGRTLMEAVVEQLAAAAPRTAPVWLPPLPTVLALGAVAAEAGSESPPTAVLASAAVLPAPAMPGLRLPIGLLDEPAQQRQGAWMLDLARSGGHVTVMGAPLSGRSTFLRTLAASLALTRTPREVSVYGLDLTGGGLGRIEGFPHVGGVATRGHRERIGRMLEELTVMLRVREEVFRTEGLDSVEDMRRRHAAGRLPQLPSADVVLLVDGFGALRGEFEEFEQPVAGLLERGGSYGMHVVATITRWNDVRGNHQSLIGTRLELRLNDAGESQLARKLSSSLRVDEPGRALTDGLLFAQVALPVREESEASAVGEALEALAQSSAEAWAGPEAAPIRLLPEDLDPASLADPGGGPAVIPLGLRQDTMKTAALDLAHADPHLLLLGDTGCGKTTTLRGIIRGAVARHTPEELVIALMDVRGGLADDIPEEYLGGHAASAPLARQLAASIAVELEKRQAARGGGPRILVVVDDFDVLAAGGIEPLRPLLPYLASARDLRLNVIATRPVLGASRALFDASLQAVRDTGGSLLLMSGDRSEGALAPRLYAEPLIPGRARLVRRGGAPTLVQVARFE
ncbi:type VII secretion protein EccCa [Microbacterium sp. 179-I 3D4 NHS]|uniref:type VII secretion protein EccCa n=1 Tax=Microbacterium sp. 179-I 3D4 NHS TaxID=3142381 RepID=UPI0039A29CB7